MKNAGTEHKIAVIAGDGIGPEVTKEAFKVLDKLSGKIKSKLHIKEYSLGAAHYLKTGETLSDKTFAELSDCDAIFLGAVGDPRVPPGILEREILLKLRFELDLFINLRPCMLYEGAFTPLKNKTSRDIDFVVVRENTESVYTGIGGVFKKGTADEVAVQEDINTRKGVERCLRYAFEYCKKHRPGKYLTLVDKANVMTYAHNLWRRAFDEVGAEYPEVKRNALFIDAACMDFVRKPEIFDVVVTNNIFGDILTDLGAIISGGLGLASSANICASDDKKGAGKYRCKALFEPVHGSAPDIAGKGLANPLAAILALGLMLDYLGENSAASTVNNAVKQAIKSGRIFRAESADLGITTSGAGDLVCGFLQG